MTRENDAEFGEEWTCDFKIDMRNLTNFDRVLKSLKNFHLKLFFSLRLKYIMFELRKYGVVMFDSAED